MVSNGGIQVLTGASATTKGRVTWAISLAGPASKRRNNDNGGRTRTKSTRNLSQSRPQEQDAAHDLPGEWREAARRCDLVRQFLRAAATRRSFAVGLQARHLDHHARSSDTAV